MYKVGIGLKWPFIHRIHEQVAKRRYEWVMLPDGRPGIVDHAKLDGTLGVRPIKPDGLFYHNTTEHWSIEDRIRIPEEIAIRREDTRGLDPKDIPVLRIHE